MMDFNFTAGKPPQTAARMDIEYMPEVPQPGYHHRRSHSDTSFRFANFDDLLLFDPSDLDSSSSLPYPSPAEPRMALETFNSMSSEDASASKPRADNGNCASFFGVHCRSLSMDSDFFDGLGMAGEGSDGEILGGRATVGEKKMSRHRHSNSMDGSFTSSFEGESTGVIDCSKKAMAPDKLAELALMDPKRAKRILANRQSATRSKERKIRYTNELEKKVQVLQSEATSISAQITVLQRDTTGLTTENRELKLRLQAMEQQAQLREALNDTLREEVQHLKIAAAQLPIANGNSFNIGGLPPQFPPLQPPMLQFGNSINHQQQMLRLSRPDPRGGSLPSQLPGA